MLKFAIKLSSCIILCLAFSACGSGPEQPAAQKNFAQKMLETAQAYDEGDTDAQKDQAQKKAVSARNEYLAEVALNPQFTDWICRVKNVETKGGSDDLFTKKPIAIVTLDCEDFSLYNADTSELFSAGNESGGVPVNAIIENTPLYNTALALKNRDYVKASGKFLARESGELHETSLTEFGSMDHPEFVVHFSEIEPVQ